MENRPFLTIGIASYNYASYLENAFEQIKKQKFKDFELLYCDDGSTDASVDMIESIIRDNPDMSIRLIKGNNEGILANRNRILEHAQGEYLLICDADDYMMGNCLQLLCETAIKEKADCVIGGFGEADASGKIYKVHIPAKNANKWIYIWHHAQIYRLEIVKKHNLKFQRIPDDLCFTQQIHLYAEKIAFVSENVYVWNRHADSTSRTIDEESDWHPKRMWKNIVDCMFEIENAICDEAEKKGIQYFLYKWYYFNIMDLPITEREELEENIRVLQKNMTRIVPTYRKSYTLKDVLKQEDTLYAKIAILLCWIIEGIGGICFLPIIRIVTWKIHR